ncbi:MAG: alpha/beta hydrolase [Flavobacteriales bacterium]
MKFQVLKTAEVTSLGELTPQTKKILFVTHGHGQLVEFFSKKLECIKHPDLFIICPEALNRFYLKGFRGRVGATWMTTQYREDDIKDNHLYLNSLLNHCKSICPKAEIHLLGFSQGAQTISRWAFFEKINYKSICLWGGRQAHDVDWKVYSNKSSSIPFELRMGDEDEFYGESKINDWLRMWREQNVAFNFELYKGKHRLEEEAMQNYAKQILNI